MKKQFKDTDKMNETELREQVKQVHEMNMSAVNQMVKAETKAADLEEEQRKSKKLSAQAVITYIVLGAPVALIIYLVHMGMEANEFEVVSNAMTFVSYFAGTITTPILMHFFGIEVNKK